MTVHPAMNGNRGKRALFGGWCLLLVTGSLSALPAPARADTIGDFQRLYGELLAAYWRPPVMIHGVRTTVFDYAQLAADTKAPGSLFARTLAALENSDPARLEGNTRKAFWLNAYNFTAIRLIVEHYPVTSIRSLKISLVKHPWSKKAVRIGGKTYSLEGIEKDVLLARTDDPRIVFAVSCAAVSCPDRLPEPFIGGRLDAQLDGMVRTFLGNPGKGLALDREAGVLTVSWIFKADEHLFPAERGGVLGFVRPYLAREIRDWLAANPVEVRYFEHDWTLNDVALAD